MWWNMSEAINSSSVHSLECPRQRYCDCRSCVFRFDAQRCFGRDCFTYLLREHTRSQLLEVISDDDDRAVESF